MLERQFAITMWNRMRIIEPNRIDSCITYNPKRASPDFGCFRTWIDLEAIHRGISSMDEKCIRSRTREKRQAKGDKRG